MVVPTDWKEVRLGEHAAFFKGNGLSKSQLIDDGPQQCVHYGELFTHYGPVIETVTSKCVAFEGSFKSLAGDVLMPGSDVTPSGLATASAIKVSDVVLGGDVIVIRTKPTSLYGPFLSNFIRMSKGRVLRLVKGSTVYHIHAKDLADLEVLMPPLKEQEAIAEALIDADAAIESLDDLISKKRDVKQATMQQLLTGRTRLPGFNADWKEVRLGDHASMRSGGTPLTSVASFYSGTIPWASISDMSASGKYLDATDRSITEAGLASSPAVVFPEGVLLYAMYASIGECCISVCPMATSQAILGIKCANDLSLEFLYYTMQSKRAEIARSGQQGTQANLNAQMVRETMFLMPPLKEQEAIAEVLSVMDDELEALTQQVSKLRMVKEGMMQDLLTGKVRLV